MLWDEVFQRVMSIEPEFVDELISILGQILLIVMLFFLVAPSVPSVRRRIIKDTRQNREAVNILMAELLVRGIWLMAAAYIVYTVGLVEFAPPESAIQALQVSAYKIERIIFAYVGAQVATHILMGRSVPVTLWGPR